jgi:uncharacterized surface protein with fasciclin (FAS1) repeats
LYERLKGWVSALRLIASVASLTDAATVAELAQHAPGNMSILVNALPRADLTDLLSRGDFKATIFAPTNRAFEAALLKLKLTPVALYADKKKLTEILSYHVVPGQALKVGDLRDGQRLRTQLKHELRVRADKAAGLTIKGADDDARVVAQDLVAGQSVIHVIDTVLLPPAKPSASVSAS